VNVCNTGSCKWGDSPEWDWRGANPMIAALATTTSLAYVVCSKLYVVHTYVVNCSVVSWKRSRVAEM
jgi:hypothetical protein